MIHHKPDLYLGSKSRCDRALLKGTLERFNSCGACTTTEEPVVVAVVNHCLESNIPFSLSWNCTDYAIKRMAH